mmetsp:Transcript_10591/g.17483  ORF Transcript_10591/g.17483 Transcript_10591/m.17483 type:complete len:190 (-) Transcript_10591:946-1515(-)
MKPSTLSSVMMMERHELVPYLSRTLKTIQRPRGKMTEKSSFVRDYQTSQPCMQQYICGGVCSKVYKNFLGLKHRHTHSHTHRYGRLVAATKMLKTAFYSQCLFYSASLCFDSLVFLVQYGIAKVRKQEAEIKDVGRKIVAKSYSFVISLGGVVIGAAVGTAIKPGRGCFWGMVAGDLAAQLLIPVSMLH